MNPDRILVVLFLVLALATGVFLYWNESESKGEKGLEQSQNPFDVPGEGPEAGHEPNRNQTPIKPSTVETVIKTPKKARGPQLPEVTSLDDFGQREAALLVQVRGQDEELLTGAEVSLHVCYQGTGHGLLRGDEMGSQVTNEKGEVRFEGLEVVSAFELFVRHESHRRYRYSPIMLEPGEYRFLAVSLGQGLELMGRVTEAESDQAVSGAQIIVYDLDDQAGNPEGAEEARASSDEDGHYKIENLSSGSKRIVAMAAGLGGSTKPYFNLLPRPDPCQMDFQLSRGASVSGQVLMPDGRPIAGARVKARPVAGQDPELSSGFYPEVLSDSLGRYRVDGLNPGFYFLRAEKLGFAEGSFAAPGEPRKTSMVNAQAGEVGINLYLGEGPVVRGRAVDADSGEAITVFDLYSDGAKDPLYLDPRKRQRVKDGQGRFEYSVPVLGSQARYIWLQARAPGYAGGRVLVDFSLSKNGQGPMGRECDDIEIKMEKGGQITGRVLAAGGGLGAVKVVASRLRDPESVPNSVLAHMPVPEVFLSAKSTLTDSEGYFELDTLAAGRYRIEYQHPDYATLVHGEEILFAGLGTEDLGSQVMTAGGQVFGQVVDDHGEAAEGSELELTSTDARLGLSYHSRTGLSGAFRFEHVPSGYYRLMVTQRSGLDTRSALYREWKKRGPKVVEVEVTEGGEHRFKLAP